MKDLLPIAMISVFVAAMGYALFDLGMRMIGDPAVALVVSCFMVGGMVAYVVLCLLQDDIHPVTLGATIVFLVGVLFLLVVWMGNFDSMMPFAYVLPVVVGFVVSVFAVPVSLVGILSERGGDKLG
jgi:peptidoglycan/LPS O-acetylase OafA/YrhL